MDPLSAITAAGSLFNIGKGLFGGGGSSPAPMKIDTTQNNNQNTTVAVSTNVGASPDQTYSAGSYFAAGGNVPVSDYVTRVSMPTMAQPALASPIGTPSGFVLQHQPASGVLAQVDNAVPWFKYLLVVGLGLAVYKHATA